MGPTWGPPGPCWPQMDPMLAHEPSYRGYPSLQSLQLIGRSGTGRLHLLIPYLQMICSVWQATGLDAWASRVKCPARFVSHLHEIYIYIWVVYSFCLYCCLFIIVTWWYVWCIEWASGNEEEVQACLVTLWLFIISYYSLYKTTLGLLCSCFENNPYFHKYSTDFHV